MNIPENLQALHESRMVESWQVPTYALPELPESEAEDIYERIVDAELFTVAPRLSSDDYEEGTATTDDELIQKQGEAVIITAEHATDHKRLLKKPVREQTRKNKDADYGTAGLGLVLAEDSGSGLIVPRGKQTGDANNDLTHPLKFEVADLISTGRFDTHVSLHGARAGHYNDFNDKRGIDVHVGVGKDPTEETVVLAEKLKNIASDLGLRAVINGRYIVNDNWDPLKPRLDEEGIPVTRSFSAITEGTTRAFGQKVAEYTRIPFASAQLELSQFLRLQPLDKEPRSRRERIMGIYLGYRVIRETLD